jgi:AraC-like DNA-binding protein
MVERSQIISRMSLGQSSGPIAIGDVVYAPGGSFGPRLQADFQLVVIHRGELEIRLDGRRTFHLAAGEAILLAPGHREHFRFSRTTETRHSWCAIRPGAVPKPLRREFEKASRPAPFLARMNLLLEWAREHAAAGTRKVQEGFFLGLGLAVLCDFVLVCQEKMSGDGAVASTLASAQALPRLREFIRLEMARPLALKDLARGAKVSPQYLLKLCRQRALPTPTRQLYARRLEAAADLLSHTGLAVGEVAERCGFANAFHFSRKFRQAYGRSPLRWRQKVWGGKTAA